ncbi:1-aminocyclopropane-1-carboxylate deaminase/D-cysteine desulfhydrase [Pedobacter montanisoli]|uniref:Pyridoxal-phosphate dependent enzyme n=1 Tax=Pedobacter montanisoli TaxID=2923277 RepID=A0ABS9ZXJ5_9SPHI|nr:pyridoxal-phosphate dependent enzyme [Pedobacter montanisoli]MCJ0743042.1 pyridoxal-phosphate dependent enzyme [Pedobacter montanisoli]
MNIYSPIQEIRFKNYQNISVKRDDLIDPYISGNKWRKLKYVLEDASNQQKKHLVTFGGAYSNHLLATAAAAARFGFKSTGFVRGEQVENETLLLCKLFGMHLIFVSRESYQNKEALFTLHFKNDQNAYFIDEGGASLLATKGCAEIIAELPQTYTHLFCAAGTGTTAAGLLKGIQQYQPNTQLHVIPVLKGGDFIKDEIAKYHEDLTGLHLHTDYHFGGYAKTNTLLLEFMRNFIQETGLLLDPVYTAKMMYAIYDLQQHNYFKENDQILALHTGGLNGIWGMKEKISQITL